VPSPTRYAALKAEGRCPLCRGWPEVGVVCNRCLKRSKARNEKRRLEQPEKIRAERARTYAMQRQRALDTKTCLTCGDPSESLNCPECLKYYRTITASQKFDHFPLRSRRK
jgi:hypothetical protein